MTGRDNWFTHVGRALSVAWFSNYAPFPTWTEAIDRLEMLRQNGPTQEAFNFSYAYRKGLITQTFQI